MYLITPFVILPTMDLQTPPSPQYWSSFYGWCAMCWNEWKIIIPIFIFRVIVKINRKLRWFEYKMTTTRKTTIRKIWNLIFLSTKPIQYLLCKFEHFWKKKIEIIFFLQILKHFWKKKYSNIFFVRVPPPIKKHPGTGYFLFGLVDPSRNRLASTAYFEIVLQCFACLGMPMHQIQHERFSWNMRNRQNQI